MSKVNCEAVGKRRQAPPGMARAELLHFRLEKKKNYDTMNTDLEKRGVKKCTEIKG